MKFTDFVCFKAIVPELQSGDRNGAIEELVSALHEAGVLSNKVYKEVAKAVIKREDEASTGLGRGVAVPHVKHKAVKNVIATIGQCKVGIDFAALDKQPVHSVILLISPVDKPELHLKAMESVFRRLQQEKFRSFLRQSRTSEQIEDLLREADDNPML